MGCGCKNKKKPEGEVVKVETGAPSTEVKIEEVKTEKVENEESTDNNQKDTETTRPINEETTSSSINALTNYNSLVEAFTEALEGMKIELDDEEVGIFV